MCVDVHAYQQVKPTVGMAGRNLVVLLLEDTNSIHETVCNCLKVQLSSL